MTLNLTLGARDGQLSVNRPESDRCPRSAPRRIERRSIELQRELLSAAGRGVASLVRQ
jgi:hypothetical protein